MDAVQNVKDYTIAESSVVEFNNIMNFVNGMTLKSSKELDDNETKLSTYFSSILRKYYEESLSDAEVENLVEFVDEYNSEIYSVLNGESFLDTDKLKLFGYDEAKYKTDIESIKYDHSYFSIILYKLIKDKIFNQELELQQEEITLEKILIAKKELLYLNNLSAASDIEKASEILINSENKLNPNVNGVSLNISSFVTDLLNIIKDNIKINKNIEIDDEIETLKDGIIELSELSKTSSISLSNHIINAIVSVYLKHFIFILKYTNQDDEENKATLLETTKNSATSLETTWASNFDILTLFDLKIKRSIASSISYGTDDIYDRYLIMYKEFNDLCYNISQAPIVDIAWWLFIGSEIDEQLNLLDIIDITDGDVSFFKNPDLLPVVIFNPKNENILTANIQRLFRNDLGENQFLLSNHTSLSLYKNIRFNPYIARQSAESDILSYYINDEYYSGGYGKDEYELTEIRNYLDIYKETRDIFYYVLLNEAFINEPEYELYEKFFILMWSIERFMTSKISNIHDIDHFNRTDISNFLQTYGLKVLDDMLITNNFYNNERYTKQLVRYYNELMKNKGSKKVVDILKRIFDFDDGDIEISKYMLVHHVKEAEDIDEYKFVNVGYNTDSLEISDKLGKASIDYNDFIDSDMFWKKEQVPTDLLKKLHVEVANTKYNSLKLTKDISSSYLDTRLTYAFLVLAQEAFTSSTTTFENCLSAIQSNVSDNDSKLINKAKEIIALFNSYITSVCGVAVDTSDQKGFKFLYEFDPSDIIEKLEVYNITTAGLDNIIDIDDKTAFENIFENIRKDINFKFGYSSSNKSTLFSILELLFKYYLATNNNKYGLLEIVGYSESDGTIISKTHAISIYSSIYSIINNGCNLINKDVHPIEKILVTDILESFFIHDNNNIFKTGTTGGSGLAEDIIEKTNALNEALKNNNIEIDELKFMLTIGEDLDNELLFLVKTIELFMSYTTFLKDPSLNIIVDDYMSKPVYVDSISNVTITKDEMDVFFYDEKITITSEDKINESEE